MKRPDMSIRLVIVALGAISILVATGLAGFGLVGTQRQLDARARVVTLDRALLNHNTADAFMDDVRTDVLRAVLSSLGVNKEGGDVIASELAHHLDVLNTGIEDNLDLSLGSELHDDYLRIVDLSAEFQQAGRAAVALALSDPVAGAANFERFRGGFSALESLMDQVRDKLVDSVARVRHDAALMAARSRWTTMGSFAVGVILLATTTAVAVRVGRRITADLADSREEARRLSLHDTLTGLPNRAFLAARLSEDLALVRRHGAQLAMLCLDLDRFKQVNDTLGHPVGDALLRAVADRLRANLRESDIVARLGGDEFAVIQMPLGSPEEAGSLAQRLIEALSAPYEINGQQVVIGASIGIALAPSDSADPDELHKVADMALYRAKLDGRGIFRLFEREMDIKLQGRRTLELDLRAAVGMGSFELHYQPLVDLSSGRVAALEALVRWRHHDRGLVAPGEFIPLAEETGLIVPLGAWVLQRACEDAAAWPRAVRVAVNVSPAQIKRANLTETVLDALTASGLAPDRLELEITETALLTETNSTLATLRELRSMGVRIAMDDFGTGYSSLGYLRAFPFDKIKIDRSFVEDIETSTDCKAIVRAVTGLGSSLQIATTAEGVETMGQLAQLQAEGCDQVQGYYFSRPVPAANVAGLLAATWDVRTEPSPIAA